MKKYNPTFKKKCECIKLVISDVDGVLTDGGMYYSEKGEVLKKFNTKDGMAVELLLKNRIKTINYFFGHLKIYFAKDEILLSRYPCLLIAIESGDQFNFAMRATSNVFERNHAQNIPKLIQIPYPIITGIGENTMARNATIVVIDVRNMGRTRALIDC